MSRHGQLERDEAAGSPGGADSARAPLGPTRRARAALPLATIGAGMATRAVSVHAREVVFVKGLVEASDGLASVFAERGGDLVLAAPLGREAELDELLADLRVEIGARIGDARSNDEGSPGVPGSAPEARGGRWDMHRQEQ